MTSHSLTFLGTGASCGVPSFYCGCKACQEALANPAAQRSCAALLISGNEHTLIDAGPELRTQLNRSSAASIDRLLLTHEHFDHIGGIPQLEYYVRLCSKRPLPVYASPATQQAIERQFEFMLDTLQLQPLAPWQPLTFDDIEYTPLPARHAKDGLGFLLRTPLMKLAYFPDTGPLPAEVLAHLQDLDILIFDATFHGNNWMPDSHHSIAEAIELSQRLGARQTYLTHLAMHYDQPITSQELDSYLLACNGSIVAAHDGLVLSI